jgi:arylsulfatase A-like enzyme
VSGLVTRARLRQGVARARDTIGLALATALVVGIIHVVVVESSVHLFRLLTWTSREFVWMAPLSYAIVLLLVATPLVPLHLLWPQLGPRVTAVPLLAVGALGLILLERSIHPVAQVLLALGIGVQGARWLASRWEGAIRVSRRVIVWGSLGTLAAGGVSAGWRRAREAVALDRAAPGGDLPNVLVLILDTVRASSLSLYGRDRATTPVLGRLAAEGTVFNQAFAPAPWSLPSHASMLTGVWPRQAGGSYVRPIQKGIPSVAQRLYDRGYRTAAFSANHGYFSHETGLQYGFSRFDDFPINVEQLLLSNTLLQTGSGHQVLTAFLKREKWRVRAALTNPDLRIVGTRMAAHRSAAEVADRFIRWRDQVDQGPWFAMLNFMDAHEPYEPPGDFASRFGDRASKLNRYEGAIAYVDSIVGVLSDALRARGDLDRTVLVITSDHGELFGEHGQDGHGTLMILPLMRVPLLIRAPGRAPPGARVDRLVSLRDLPATLLDLTGTGPSLPGNSLANAWRPGGGATSPVLIENDEAVNLSPDHPASSGAMEGMIDDAWHYVRMGNGREYLWAWRTDSAETVDLSGSPEGPGVIADLRRRMRAALALQPAAPNALPGER